MANPSAPTGVKPKKKLTIGRILLYAFALIGLVWIGIWGYWEFFKLKLWLAGFGTGVFWAAGLVVGFIYFYMIHKLHAEIKVLPSGAKKMALYTAFGLGIAILNPFSLSATAWLFTPPSSLHTAALWFFVGCALGVAIVLGLERLFAKTKPKSDVRG